MLKEISAKYKCFEHCFFKADKTQDLMVYLKLKHQFRTMATFSAFTLVLTAYMLSCASGSFLKMSAVFILRNLDRIQNKILQHHSNNIFHCLHTDTSQGIQPTYLALLAPAAILFSNVQVLVQTQSDNLMMIHLGVQAIGFYFYGMDFMAASIRRMSTEELVESARIAILYTFLVAFMNLACMKVFNSQFSRLLKKVSSLKDNLSKVNSQLNDQNHKLQSNLEMKDVFIYTFSHELKNALNGLLGNLYLAYDTAKDAGVLQFLTSAKVCGEVLKNFVHNILDSGKLENGNLEVARERKDVMSFMENLWAICGRIIQNKRLKGFLEIEKNVPRYLDAR